MTIDPTLYSFRTLQFYKFSMQLAFDDLMLIVLISLDLRVILNNISGVNYHFIV